MAIILNQNLFSWDELDAESDLYRMELVLNNLPDEELMLIMETKRANGRDTYPIRPMWNALIAGIVFQHDTIDTRQMWKDEKSEQGFDADTPITRQICPGTSDNIVFTERGCVHCVCPVTGSMSRMQFMGFEAKRDSLKYRCPAAAFGFECRGRSECERTALGRPTDFGRVVRVSLDYVDRRIFTPIPRDSPQWKRIYADRTSVERFNARIDQGLRFENYTIRGLAKMQTRMGLALSVSLAMAVGFISQGKPEFMRSLVGSPRKKRLAA